MIGNLEIPGVDVEELLRLYPNPVDVDQDTTNRNKRKTYQPIYSPRPASNITTSNFLESATTFYNTYPLTINILGSLIAFLIIILVGYAVWRYVEKFRNHHQQYDYKRGDHDEYTH